MQLKKSSIRPIKILGGLVAIAYPFAVFVALQHGFSVRMMGLFLVCIALVALARRRGLWFGVCGIILAGIAFVSNCEIFLKLYPVLMNAAVCGAFAVSLNNVPLVQKIAEKVTSHMDDASIHYAYKMTIGWTIFMGINTIISFATVFMSDLVWTLYNGLISYCLIGIMIIVGYLCRPGVKNENK